MMNQQAYRFTVIVFTIIAVWLITAQSRLVADAQNQVSEREAMRYAYETIETLRTNTSLVQEIEQLKAASENYKRSVKDKSKLKEDLEDKQAEYARVNGTAAISGRGIEITVSGGLITEEMTDLMNGIRNIKPDAIAINGKRVIYRSYFVVDNDILEFDDHRTHFPFTIQIIGDPVSLEQSLARSGGILDVLRKNSFGKAEFSVTKHDILEVPAYERPFTFRYAQSVQ